MTKKYFFVKGENPETKSKFVSICTNVDFADVCKMYRSKGLYVYSITILCQAKADEPICINSINYNSTINDRQYITNYMINRTNLNKIYIPDNIIDNTTIDALNIGKYNFDKINLPIQDYHVCKDFSINIFPTINGKIKTVIFSKNTLVLVKSDMDKVYIRIIDDNKESYYLSINKVDIGKDYFTMTFVL